MTVTQTTRLEIYRWDSPTDPFTRQQMDDSHANLESKVGIFLKGTLASRPSAGDCDRGFYFDTDNTLLYYSDGSQWRTVTSFAAPTSTLTPGDANSAGAASTNARSDHSHAMLAWASTVASTSAGSGTAGAATTYSRGDHSHPIADNAVVAGKIATGGVSAASQLASNVVTEDKILDSNVTRNKIVATERIPTGAIFPYAGMTAPSGWLFCNGQEVAAGSDLGTLLSTRFNTGGETPGFVRVPNLSSRFPLGVATMGVTTVGTQSGATTATLTSNELPAHVHAAGTIAVASHADHTHTPGSYTPSTESLAHTHSIDHTHAPFTTAVGGTHQHGFKYAVAASGSSYNMARLNSSSETTTTTDGTMNSTHSHDISIPAHSGTSGAMSAGATHTHSITGSSGNPSTTLSHSVSGSTGSTGSGNAFSIMPPSLTVNYIIKM